MIDSTSSLSSLKTATKYDGSIPITGYDGDEPETVHNLNTNIEYLMEGYSRFLDDGDYERFMPYTNQVIDFKVR